MSRKVVTTTYEYDAQGRMTKETVVTEDHTPGFTYQPVQMPVWPQPPRYYPHYGTTWNSGGTVKFNRPEDPNAV